ncbi:hypothetical protein P154DRAFT_31352 [Amniculicola lignicola CBS 123094]|uniref:Uncharacterized protein n=1 Tax=Amniculicola lignicola CBS 123094 TaxID=1392246 RepID=A0A6A5VYF2_9PLEO|nr:hypothetical protein P154DRAFT_31352 [Amniculicola lignicola CBS 123094]
MPRCDKHPNSAFPLSLCFMLASPPPRRHLNAHGSFPMAGPLPVLPPSPPPTTSKLQAPFTGQVTSMTSNAILLQLSNIAPMNKTLLSHRQHQLRIPASINIFPQFPSFFSLLHHGTSCTCPASIGSRSLPRETHIRYYGKSGCSLGSETYPTTARGRRAGTTHSGELLNGAVLFPGNRREEETLGTHYKAPGGAEG